MAMPGLKWTNALIAWAMGVSLVSLGLSFEVTKTRGPQKNDTALLPCDPFRW